MPPRAIPIKPARPPPTELIRMISGPRVDVIVGANKKHYSLPKDLLCYYSSYFDRCFNGQFKETTEQKLELLEDKVYWFEILVEFMPTGTTSAFTVPWTNSGMVINHCRGFLRYIDKYGMGYVGDAVHEPLKTALCAVSSSKSKKTKKKDLDQLRPSEITAGDIEDVFRVCPAGSKVRRLVVQAAIAYHGPKKITFQGAGDEDRRLRC